MTSRDYKGQGRDPNIF